jgi:hypothetical protein
MWFRLYCEKWNKFIKFGVLLHPKQKYKCREYNKQFVLNPEKHISEEKKAIIDKLLLEKISLRGIARSVGVSGVWGWSSTPSLQKYVKEKYQEQPEELHVQKKDQVN